MAWGGRGREREEREVWDCWPVAVEIPGSVPGDRETRETACTQARGGGPKPRPCPCGFQVADQRGLWESRAGVCL